VDLNEHITFVIQAMTSIADELGLTATPSGEQEGTAEVKAEAIN
jgi:hypothetical protein